ncbi:hypothetical protein BDV93DRAFT_590000 [Ceratobasidium sp. AG-I]|nr:hypothetical protein BDV93DRAFT_590000 [Ceratobasidium sp. AG-I]
MSYVTQRDDVLLIPCASTMKGAAGDIMTPVRVDWQQHFKDYKEKYYWGIIHPKGKPSEQVVFFIQSEWYLDTPSPPDSHISRIAPKVGDFYEFTVNDKARYGQSNSQGEGRFIVYHDTERNPNQKDFVDPGKGVGGKVLGNLGMSDNDVKNLSGPFDYFFGDTLLKF